VALGRKHHFRIEWKAAFHLMDNATCFLKREEP